ncbi:MAG: universal stress protein [Bacteroidota bacterium]
MASIRHILCPVDFSPLSDESIEKASFLATFFQADLTLLHVIPTLPKRLGMSKGRSSETLQLVAKAEEVARQHLRQAKKRHVPYAVKCKSLVKEGELERQVLEAIAETACDLLMVAVSGPEISQPLKTLLTSSPCPVLTYQGKSQRKDQGELIKGFRNVLLPLPVDPIAREQARSSAAAFWGQMSAGVHLIMAVHPAQSPSEQLQVQALLEEEIQRYAEGHFSRVTGQLIVAEDWTEPIVAIADQHQCDLILMPPGTIPQAAKRNGDWSHNLMQKSGRSLMSLRAMPKALA